jgi:heavy metal translocating P-type ATPase
MDESFLTGEPFHTSKTSGSLVISGSLNGENVLNIKATQKAQDSRYAKITKVMHESEQKRPHARRLGDKLGSWYTPVALTIATLAGVLSGDPIRFLSVLVVATPCPLLIGIPIAIIGSISLAAKKSIIIKNPVALEQISEVEIAIFDKTGTLTYGQPELIDLALADGFNKSDVLALAAGIEAYSKHPLSHAILNAAKKENLHLPEAHNVSEKPGEGLIGTVDKRKVKVTSRKKLLLSNFQESKLLPPTQSGLECVVPIDDHYAATMRFHDSPRAHSKAFIAHLSPRHKISKGMIISGDRENEVKYLAEQVGITEIYSQQSPEEKVELVRAETLKAKTLYVGDGINDAPAMMAATVGISMGQNSEVTSEAADVVILDSSLLKVDQFMHISARMKRIILHSALGGMVLSIAGMGFASFGYLSPVAGAIFQEVIDVLAVLNALRAAFPPKVLSDLE